MSRYVIEAIIGMPKEHSRIAQDIVKVALNLERDIPVELNLEGEQIASDNAWPR